MLSWCLFKCYVFISWLFQIWFHLIIQQTPFYDDLAVYSYCNREKQFSSQYEVISHNSNSTFTDTTRKCNNICYRY